MDHYEVHTSRPNSATIDIEETDWGDTEEIELESEEHDLFLHEDYVKPTNKDILPFRAISPSSHKNGINERLSKSRSQNHHQQHGSTSTGNNDSQSKIEFFQVDDSGRDSPISSSVVYHMPNYQQFAGNLAPSSPTSVVVSFIIIVVILFVTIVPIILPQGSSTVSDSFDNVIDTNISNAQSQIEHADARCKCICPPPPQTHKDEKLPEPKRRLYVGNTSPDQCNCNNIVQPHLTDTKIILKDFCVRCECRYQSRNTTTIRRNVIFFIAVLLGLGIFMFLQYLLKYLRITRRNLPRQLRWLSHQLTESG